MHKVTSRHSQTDTTESSVPRNDSFPLHSEDSLRRSTSPVMMSPESPTGPHDYSKRRSDSYNSRKSNEDHRRYNNTVYYYGRHSNYWLFGGFSVRDTVRDGVDWLRQQGKKS